MKTRPLGRILRGHLKVYFPRLHNDMEKSLQHEDFHLLVIYQDTVEFLLL